MTELEIRLAEAKQRFSTATAQALAGDDSAWHRAEILSREVQQILSAIEQQRQHAEGRPA